MPARIASKTLRWMKLSEKIWKVTPSLIAANHPNMTLQRLSILVQNHGPGFDAISIIRPLKKVSLPEMHLCAPSPFKHRRNARLEGPIEFARFLHRQNHVRDRAFRTSACSSGSGFLANGTHRVAKCRHMRVNQDQFPDLSKEIFARRSVFCTVRADWAPMRQSNFCSIPEKFGDYFRIRCMMRTLFSGI